MSQTIDTPAMSSLAELHKQHDEALAVFLKADKTLDSARRDQMAALNELNAAQKAIDERMAQVRSKAPPGSDWAHSRLPKVPA